ncbi:helix-turn-helix domain-containing protein [Cupriavidus respiraculi]|nr:helix-turn-helix domain-containing protein [Cupriavidus respiraculi]MBY4949532.1 response regulator [Cupriavidus respiraculi]
MQQDQSAIDWLSIANQVRDIMVRHGVAKRSHAGELGRLLGVSFSAASRKLKGQLPWTLSQLKAVAEHYGEPSRTLLDGVGEAACQPCPGVLALGPLRLVCEVWIGQPLASGLAGRRHAVRQPTEDPVVGEFVATKVGEQWSVYDVAAAPASALFQVERIVIPSRCADPDKPVIAVVDDAPAVTDTLCEYLNEQGFDTRPYYDMPSFLQALHGVDFDGFILDWSVGHHTAAEPIERIRRSENADAPVILLTGRGQDSEAEIARLVDTFNVFYAEKPLKLAILLAQLTQALQPHGRGASRR